MAVDPYHRWSNESERANWDSYDDFKLKKSFGLQDFHLKKIGALGVNMKKVAVHAGNQ